MEDKADHPQIRMGVKACLTLASDVSVWVPLVLLPVNVQQIMAFDQAFKSQLAHKAMAKEARVDAGH